MREPDRYAVLGAASRTLDGRGPAIGVPRGPFDAVGLLNRYTAEGARLELTTDGAVDTASIFASATDLGTGEERPIRLAHRDRERAVVAMERCPARTLLRLHWPLATR